MQHNPTLHIFIGVHNHFFTLRESYLHTTYFSGKPVYEVRYNHLKNLSQNWEEAITKAKESSRALGIPLIKIKDMNMNKDEDSFSTKRGPNMNKSTVWVLTSSINDYKSI